jgi:hypothetical protein
MKFYDAHPGIALRSPLCCILKPAAAPWKTTGVIPRFQNHRPVQFINRGTLKRDWETEVVDRENGCCIDSMQSAQSPAGTLLRFLRLNVAAKMTLTVSTRKWSRLLRVSLKPNYPEFPPIYKVQYCKGG